MSLSKKEVAILNSGWSGTFVVADTECNGFTPNNNIGKLLEVAGVKVKFFDVAEGRIVMKDEMELIDKFERLVYPELPFKKPTKKNPHPGRVGIQPKITELTGITDEMVATADTFDVVLKDFDKFCEGSVLSFHNARYDVSFLHYFGSRVGLNFKFRPIVDTLQLSYILLDGEKGTGVHKAENLAARFGINDENHHRALNDSMVEAQIFFNFMKMMNEKGLLKVVDKYEDLANFEDVDTSRVLHISEPNVWASRDCNMKRFYTELFYETPKGRDYGCAFYDFGTERWDQSFKKNKRRDRTNDGPINDFDAIKKATMDILGIDTWDWPTVFMACNRGNTKTYWNSVHGNNSYGQTRDQARLELDDEVKINENGEIVC